MDFFRFFTIMLIGSWVLTSHIVQNSLQNYATTQYYPAIILSSIALTLVGIVGMFIHLNQLSACIVKVKIILQDRLILVFVITVLLGYLINPLFLIIFSVIVLFYKSSEIKNSDYIEYLIKTNIVYLITLFSIFLGIIYPTGAISAATADQRNSTYNVTRASRQNLIINYFGSDTKNFTLAEWVNTINQSPNPSQFNGKQIFVDGFIHIPLDTPSGFVKVSRFIVRCCAADATPIGIALDTQELQNPPKSNQWVNVRGVLQYDNERDFVYIQPFEVKYIDQPQNPYAY
jgi:uncharacterized repeat protein (TIGR03943 family)